METRRKFLEKLSVTAIGLPLLSHSESILAATEIPYQGPVLRVAIMGLGSYATRVANAMQDSKRAKLVGVISGTPSKIDNWQKKYGISKDNCYNYSNMHQIKNNDAIDAVYIITPNGLHKEHTLMVAKAGKHVICEKPMAINPQEGQEMIDACKAAKVKLLVGYRMHFEANTLEIVNMRKAGDFGKIMFFQGLSGFIIGNPNQWRLERKLSGGGAMMDIGIYSINGARYMVGEEPIWVTAQETKTDPIKFKEGIDETIQFQMGFPSGAVASCLSTYSANHLDRFFLNGIKGYAQMQPSTGYGPIKGRTHLGELQHKHITHQTVQMDEMARIILENKAALISVDGEEGLKDLKIIEAIYKAVATGTKVYL